MKFTTWLITQTNREDPVGDLARDVRDDVCMDKPCSYGKARTHVLMTHNDAEYVVEALNRARDEFANFKAAMELQRIP